MKRTKAFVAILLVLSMALVFAGCGSRKSASYDSAREYGYYAEPEAAYDVEMPMEAAVMDEGYALSSNAKSAKAAGMVSTTSAQDSGADTNLTGNVAGRKIIKNGDLSIQTREFDEFLTSLNRAIAAVGGYVEASSVSGNSYNRNRMRSAEVTARIPAESLDSFCDQVSDLGNVTYKNLYIQIYIP